MLYRNLARMAEASVKGPYLGVHPDFLRTRIFFFFNFQLKPLKTIFLKKIFWRRGGGDNQSVFRSLGGWLTLLGPSPGI